MRFSALATLLPLLLSSSVFAISRDVIRARQAHVKKDLVDVCVALDLDVVIAPGGLNIVAGHLNLCLCLAVLPGFLNSNSVARNVVGHLGSDAARNYFTGLIQSQQNKHQCNYPPNATPFCSIQSPCDFTCGNGYTPSPSTNPTQCVCKWPSTECNGVCGSFPHGCGSQRPSKRTDNRPTCAASETMCGVPNGSGVDCVDTFTSPESCGGCTVASPFGNNVADGTNCKALPNVKDADCDRGSCLVSSCEDGFAVSTTRDSCVKAPANRVRNTADAAIISDCFNRLQRNGLLTPGFDIGAAEKQILAEVLVITYGNVLQWLILQGAVIAITNLLVLADSLGIALALL